jgi:hypothetical protein
MRKSSRKLEWQLLYINKGTGLLHTAQADQDWKSVSEMLNFLLKVNRKSEDHRFKKNCPYILNDIAYFL